MKPIPDWAKSYAALTTDDRGPSIEEIREGKRDRTAADFIPALGINDAPIFTGAPYTPVDADEIRAMVDEYAVFKRDGDDPNAEITMKHIIDAFEGDR